MSQSHRDVIQKTLWPKGEGQSIWAILDGARDRRIYSELVNSYQESACLYAGDLSPALEAAAPHLVRLDYNQAFTKKILELGWGNSWGVFFYCDDSFDRIRKHLRRFLRVQDESGKNLVFRYYDPRVLRVYLPTCMPKELETVYGPIRTFWTEDRDPAKMLEFTVEGSKLKEKTIALGATVDSAHH